ncbi:MAG: hypothetical protein O7E53_02335, partial [Alphaproteobacteria bacterium]|nr:hypothetical protein [Alphaproteobacteria bacterium]
LISTIWLNHQTVATLKAGRKRQSPLQKLRPMNFLLLSPELTEFHSCKYHQFLFLGIAGI